MGLFDFLKKAPTAPEAITFPAVLGAVANGKFVAQEELPDEIFSTGVLGPCCGVDPSEGKIYAPLSGKITQLADTLHAVGIEAGGIEILIHVGMDTVDMNGDGFTAKVKNGQIVNKGELLLCVDLDKVRKAGHPTVAVVVVTNADDFANVEAVGSGSVSAGDPILKVSK